jgi:peptidoglycan/LPS O-acetylase OafA/YrhL
VGNLVLKPKIKNFRNDITVLRAYAVIAVVLYHFNPSYLPGGFAGVDVFFVISGYLMTSIVFSGITNNKFSLISFYRDRVNRILPPLFIVCLVLMLYGYFFLTPLDYKELSAHVASSISFLSNFVYWLQSGYFEASSLEKWLLHTWSLSVEWQFYIIFPIIVLLFFKFFSLQIVKSVFLVLTFSFLLVSIFFSISYPDSAYFLLHTRAWEMLAGSLVYLYPLQFSVRRSKVLIILGSMLILASYLIVYDSSNWPGYMALFPVLGASLIILASLDFSFSKFFAVFNIIGLSSYSVYLWHWPILVAINYYSLSGIYLILGFFLSFFVGYLSFKYIERGRFFSYKVMIKGRKAPVCSNRLKRQTIFFKNLIKKRFVMACIGISK